MTGDDETLPLDDGPTERFTRSELTFLGERYPAPPHSALRPLPDRRVADGIPTPLPPRMR